MFIVFLSYFYFFPCIISDLSIYNIVWLDSADTRTASQDAVKKVLELTEKWKYPIFRGKF